MPVKKSSYKLNALLSSLLALGAASTAKADVVNWLTTPASQDWRSAANWSTGTTPTTSSQVFISSSADGLHPIIGAGVNIDILSLEIGDSASGKLQMNGLVNLSLIERISIGGKQSGTLEINGGATLNSPDYITVGIGDQSNNTDSQPTTFGLLTVNSGTVNSNNGMYIGSRRSGTVNLNSTASVLNVREGATDLGSLRLGHRMASGTLNINTGGRALISNQLILGGSLAPSGWTAGSGTATVQGTNSNLVASSTIIGNYASGTLTIQNSGEYRSDSVIIGLEANATGVLNLDSGSLIRVGKTAFVVGVSGSGTLNLGSIESFRSSDFSSNIPSIIIAQNPGSTGVLYYGRDVAGNPTSEPGGGFGGADIRFGAGDGELVILANDPNPIYIYSTWTSDVPGAGRVIHRRDGLTYTTPNSTNYSGVVIIERGTYSIGNGGYSGKLSGTVIIDPLGTLAINHTFPDGAATNPKYKVEIAANIQGTGAFIKQGTAEATLLGNNIGFSGAAVVTSGYLVAGAENSLGGALATYQINNGGNLNTGEFNTTLASMNNDGTTVIGGADTQLTLSGAYTQSTSGTLDLTVTGSLTKATLVANSVDLNGQLKISGYSPSEVGTILKASELNNLNQLLIQSNSSITGDFFSTVVGQDINNKDLYAISTVDYLTNGRVRLNDDSTQVLISELDLSWTEGKSGTFTLDAGTAFEVDVPLDDIPSPASGWDGMTLTKEGTGTLILNAVNSYSGPTNINSGTLSVSAAANLGGNGEVYLGSPLVTALPLPLDPALSPSSVPAEPYTPTPPAASLVFENASGTGSITATFTNDLVIASRSDNTISVTDAGSIIDWTGSISGGGFIKTGAGQLNLSPISGKNINYTGDTLIAEGAVVFKANGGGTIDLTGNIYVAGAVSFDTDDQITLTGNIQSGLNTLSRALVAGLAEKTGTGTLLIVGNSMIDWQVTGGTLEVTSETFNSNVTLSAGTSLLFAAVPGVTPPPIARYSGLLTGDTTSNLELNRPGSTLFLDYNRMSTIGNVTVTTGYLAFEQIDEQPAPETNTVERFSIAGNLNVGDGATVAITRSNTYLQVGQDLILENNSSFDIALDAARALVGDVLVNGSTTIRTNTSLTMLGFAVPLNYDTKTDTDFSKVFKASQLPSYEYLVLDSANTIVGTFTEPAAGAVINKPSYILYELQYRNDSNSNATTSPNSEVWLGNFRLAWLEGGTTYGTGTFTMEEGTALNIDVALPNMPGPFDSGWDGTSLDKTGKGLLILSNPDNTYTGSTRITEGTLVTGADDVLDNSKNILVGPDAVLDINNSTQHVQQIDSSGTIDLGLSGEIIINNLGPNNETVNSTLGGTITGGNLLHNGGTDSTIRIQNGEVNIAGNIDVDRLIFAPKTTININNGGSVTGITNGAGSTVNVNSGGTWTLTDNSTAGNVTLNSGGSISFGDPSKGLGNEGRTLIVDNWTGNNGKVTLYGKNDNGMPKNDQIIVNGTANGSTDINLIDTGGLIDLAAADKKIILVQPGPNGQINEGAFNGTFTSGYREFKIALDRNGNIVVNPGADEDVGISSLGRQYLSLIGSLTKGQTSHAVVSLGSLNEALDNTQTLGSCSIRQTFGSVSGANGDSNQSSSYSTSDYRQYSLIAGSDWYGTELANGCVRVGAMIGYQDLRSDVDLNGVSLGRNNLDSKQLGAYVRYQDRNNWYGTVAMMHYWDDLKVESQQDIRRDTDSQSWALSFELGMKKQIKGQWSLNPSAQFIYQHTDTDNVTTSQQITNFDKVNSSFIRLGTKASYDMNETTRFNVHLNMWHQLSGRQTIKAYGLNNGQLLNTLSENESPTWGDLGVGVESANKNLSVFGKVGYQGNFSGTNALTGQFGIRYKW